MAKRFHALALAGASTLVACSGSIGGSDPLAVSENGGGGMLSTGGSWNGGTGGAPFGGGLGTGGAFPGGGASGVTGGAPGAGGASAGGASSNGGALGAGGDFASGGAFGSGGDFGAGGALGGGGAIGSGGAVGNGGALGSGGAVGTGGSGTGGAGACPAAPVGSTAGQVTALQIVNDLRTASGAGCATMVAPANTSSTLHCDYYAANTGACIADPHSEVSGCTGFVAASFGSRMKSAGYTGQAAFEVMAFSNDPTRAIAQWVNSVWHRLPILNPWVTEFGYGAATKCDTMDFGRGTPAPATTVVLYPYAGQTGLPTSFDGSREGPTPPAPASGWPSGSPITVYAKAITVTTHVISVQSTGAPLAHTLLTSADSSFLRDDIVLYTDAPFAAATTYRVQITGTDQAGALNLDWTFTTK